MKPIQKKTEGAVEGGRKKVEKGILWTINRRVLLQFGSYNEKRVPRKDARQYTTTCHWTEVLPLERTDVTRGSHRQNKEAIDNVGGSGEKVRGKEREKQTTSND